MTCRVICFQITLHYLCIVFREVLCEPVYFNLSSFLYADLYDYFFLRSAFLFVFCFILLMDHFLRLHRSHGNPFPLLRWHLITLCFVIILENVLAFKHCVLRFAVRSLR